jgi:SAM-dependent methyltransferase
VVSEAEPEYLRPYLSAARRHGEGFKSLLWESPRTQGVRFHAMTRVCDFHGKSVLDVGCGRGDLLDWLRERGIEPEHYTGLEAVEPLARAAMGKRRTGCLIVRGDFMQEPKRLFVGADVIAFSGSLNTLEPEAFYRTLGTAWDAATEAVVFNFLKSSERAGASYLYWHKPAVVKQFVRAFSEDVRLVGDYLDGDCTICVRKHA